MPRVLRPRNALLTAVSLSVVLVVAAGLGWALLPAETRELFTGPQLATLVFFVLVMIGVMLGVGLSSVRVDADGLLVRNGPRTHRIAWSQVRGFRFTSNDPWAYVLLDGEPESRPLIALQRVDGERAKAAFSALKADLAEYLRRAG